MILDRIVAAKRAAHARRAPVGLDELIAKATALPPGRGLHTALATAPTRPAVIAEFKRRSPSAGPIRPCADPAAIAPAYAAAGAAALSVLTDVEFFDGDSGHLAAARLACALPLLRKDFLLDERDVVESRLLGADAVLLIVRLLAPAELGALVGTALTVGLDTLVEVHSEREAEVALAAGARLIGVNHRDLDTLTIDLDLSARIRRGLTPSSGVLLVGESGIQTRADVARMRAAGMDAILVGESLMRAPDPGRALADLLA
jgi:indole-3-glycerol phosphate synthase